MSRIILLVLLCATISCGEGDPSIVIVSLPQDTSDTQGPYRVEAIPEAPRGIFSFELIFDSSSTLDVEFAPVPGGEQWQAEIPGQSVGTRVSYSLKLVTDAGTIIRAPAQGSESFDVIPSR